MLCVDDFGIKYHNKEDLDHLINDFRTKYEASTDITGSNYIGLAIDWNYKEEYVDILMPDYVVKALKKFQHISPNRQQHTPHKWTEPVYDQKVQYSFPDSSLLLLDKKVTT